MDKFDFMSVISDQFKGLKSEEEIELMAKKIIQMVVLYKGLAKGYLEFDIL